MYSKKCFKEKFEMPIKIFFYNHCILCYRSISLKNIICRECLDDIHEKNKRRCEICSVEIDNSSICGQCIIDKPPYKKHISFGDYNGKLRKLIILYKFNQFERLKHLFSKLYMECLCKSTGFLFDVIIPVPGDKSRRRSFDPVLEICKTVSRRTSIPLLTRKLIKVKKTTPQINLGYNSRLKNLNGAFKILKKNSLKGRRVLLIDDVYTTGTTVKKCVNQIAKETEDIYVITLARSKDIFKDS